MQRYKSIRFFVPMSPRRNLFCVLSGNINISSIIYIKYIFHKKQILQLSESLPKPQGNTIKKLTKTPC